MHLCLSDQKCLSHFILLLFHSAFSSLTDEEEIQESLTLTDKTRTHELKPETKSVSRILGRKAEKPVFLSTLSPVAVTVGETVVFTVRVSSFPEASIQWFHNGQRIASSSEYHFIHELENYSLVINKTQTEHEGEYFCSVSNPFGQSTCSSHLLVQLKEPERGREVDLTPHDKPPKFTKAIESSEVPQGGQCFFRYVVTGQPLPDIQWLKGSFHIQPNEFCVIINNPDGSGFIHMKNVKLEHSGVYTCKAFNQYGEDCCTADLLVVAGDEHKSVQKMKRLKMTMCEDDMECRSRLERTQSGQMIYTISTEDRQIIPSEEVVPLREVEVFTAAPKREQHTHQAAVLQSHELKERVSCTPAPPLKVSAVPTEHLQMEMLLPSVKKQNVIEQPSLQMFSPEVLKPELAVEQPSKLMLATSEEVIPLMTVRDTPFTGDFSELIQVLPEPLQLTSGNQEESTFCTLGTMLGSTYRAQQDRKVRATKDFKALYLAQSVGQPLLLEAHSEPLLASDAANQSFIGREQPKAVVAPVSESQLALHKENQLEIQRQEHESIRPCRQRVCQSAITTKEVYKFQTEQTGEVPFSGSPVSLKRQHEGKSFLHLQVICDQNVLQSEGQLSRKDLLMEQAKVRRNLPLLHLVTQEEQMAVVSETTLQFSAETEATSFQPTKEQQRSKHVQSVHSSPILSMEGQLTDTRSEEQKAFRKQEKVLSFAAPSEVRQEITADFCKNLDLSMVGVKPQCHVESRLLSMLPVSSQVLQLPKETPLVANLAQQRALLEKEDYQNIRHSLNITDTQIVEEAHTTSLDSEERFEPESRTEPDISKNSVFIRENAVATESCEILKGAEQDFALHIKEGQSIYQSVLLEEKQVMLGDQATVFYEPESSTVSMNNQSKEAMFVHESKDAQTLPKELSFVIDLPTTVTLSVQHHLRDALQSALASDHMILLSDAVQRLESVEIHEVKTLREPTQFSCAYVITSPGVPLDITLFFQGDCHQIADMKSELQLALHAMVFKEQQSFTPEQATILQKEMLQKAQISSAPSTKKLSSLVGDVLLMENVVGFPPDAPNFAKVKTEALASFHNAIVQNKSEINESRQENLKTESPKRHWTAAEGQHMDRSTHRETREKCLSEIVMDSESISITTDSPLVVNSLKDICAKENSNTLFTATIKNVTKVLWYFNGQLVKSGTEFMCSKHHDTYTLAINTVAKEKHEGQYVCEAVNDVGRTTTSSRLTVISRGLMMAASLISTTNFTP